MSNTLTPRQQQVLDCIRDFIRDTGMAPTRAEIADNMGFRSKNAAADHLRALERKQMIRLYNDRSRGIQLLEASLGEEESLPIIGQVAAGTPIDAIQNLEGSLPVPPSLFRKKPTYLLRVRGDSMRDAGILDGDLIAIRKANTALNGDIVVARIDDEVTVKTLKIDRKSATLLPSNPDYAPIHVNPEELVIEGTFVGLIRDVG